MTNRPHILLIYTGGTIGMYADPQTGALRNFDFGELRRRVPELGRIAADLDVQTFANPIDSSDMEPSDWADIARIIARGYERYDGFVVLHGTDTMAYTASALSFMLQGLAKPVVLTGSQLPIDRLRTDGRENLLTAIEIAAARRADGGAAVPEVCVYFDSKLLRGNRTTKINSEGFNAFRSFNFPALAEAGIHIRYNEGVIRRPVAGTPFRPCLATDSHLVVFTLFPGISRSTVKAITSAPGLKAVVMRAYGTGNAPGKQWLIDELKELEERDVVVVVVTQCAAGSVEPGRYATGRRLLDAGIVNGRDATVEATVTKLMCLLGRGLSQQEVRRCMNTSLAGEMTV